MESPPPQQLTPSPNQESPRPNAQLDINSFGPKAIQLSIDLNSKADELEAENKKMLAQAHEHVTLLRELDTELPRTKKTQEIISEKKRLLEEKRKELVAVQAAILDTLQNPEENEAEQKPCEILPLVLNRVQALIMQLTDSSVDSGSLSVPVLDIFKAGNTINTLFDAIAQKGLIEESQEEHQERMTKFVSTQKVILGKLQSLVIQAQTSEEEEAAEEKVAETQATVEEVKEEQPAETSEEQPKESPSTETQ